MTKSKSNACCFLILCLGLALARPLQAQSVQITDRSLLVPGDTIEVVAGSRYQAGWLHRWFFGGARRAVWNQPVRIPVLDLDSYAGGITAFRTGGFGQTNTLHFRSGSGQRFTFRSVDKDPERGLPEEFKGTLVADVRQDFVSALHPGAAAVAAPILQAAGVLHVTPRLVVLPYHPRLGEFRETFAGMLGWVEERPNEGPDGGGGFAGLTSIVGVERILSLLEEGPENRVDVGAYLVARLVDFLVGDRDRHKGQWRWGRVVNSGDQHLWWPIPEDRDEALIYYDGLVMSIVSFLSPKIVSFTESYPNVAGLSFNGWDFDRMFLPELDKSQWDSIAVALQMRVTDSVIDQAVNRLPQGYQDVSGAQIRRSLRSRRDDLTGIASRFYEFLIPEVDITATDHDEALTVSFLDSGVRVEIRSVEGGVQRPAYYDRTFLDNETDELRIYLQGGDDSVAVGADGGSSIKVRVLGGGGDDVFARAINGDISYYDNRGDNTIDSHRADDIDSRDYRRPPSSAPLHDNARDFGSLWAWLPAISYIPDVGLRVGASAKRHRYGFRKHPYSNLQTFHGVLSTELRRASAGYSVRFMSVARRLDAFLGIRYSGFQTLHFHGFGNETSISGVSSDVFDVERQSFRFEANLRYLATDGLTFSLGPVVTYSSTEQELGTLLEAQKPLGVGSFGQVGARLGFEFDTRNRPVAASEGVFFTGDLTAYPSLWTNGDSFTRVGGQLAGYLSASIPTSPTLGVRIGAQKIWGTAPFFESAILGGAGDLRGFSEQRFAGDASVFGNAELRLSLLPIRVVVPGELGVFGLADVGRVYLDGESSSEIHAAFGGGIWISLLDPANTLSVGVARSTEQTGVYVRSGFHF